MRILVTGGSGTVGYALSRSLASSGNEVHFTYFSHECAVPGAVAHKLDVSEKGQLQPLGERFDAIVHCAALTNVDLCETDPSLARRQNVGGTANALGLAKECGAHFIFISTSHVFPASQSAYPDSHEVDPGLAANEYGRSKAEAELLVRSSSLDAAILRIDQPYGWVQPWQKDNTVTRTLRRLAKKEEVREPTDWLNCPTFLPLFSGIVSAVLQKRICGAYNSAGVEYLSRLEWARKAARAFGFDPELIRPVSAATFKLPAARPNVELDSSAVYSKTGVKRMGMDETLLRMKNAQPRP